MPSNLQRTVLHYTGSEWDGSGVHAVIRQLSQAPYCRSILGVSKGFVADRQPRLRVWRGPVVQADQIGLANLGRTFLVSWRVRRWLSRGAHRIFHGHSRAGLLVGLWLRLCGVRRVVVSVHVYGRHRWFYRIAEWMLGARLVWLTPAMKRYYGIGDVSWNGCIPNGLNHAFPSSMRLFPGGRPVRIGGAGMLVRWKRWDLVLEALLHMPAGCSLEFFHIGGAVDSEESREYERELKALIRNRGLEGRVSLLGWQSSSAELLRWADVIVVPSDGEPFSMIALEAMFAGVPVIATRGGGPEDFIRDNENGWLVPPGDAVALAKCFTLCLEPKTWTRLQVSTAHLQQFSVSARLATCWAEFYDRL